MTDKRHTFFKEHDLTAFRVRKELTSKNIEFDEEHTRLFLFPLFYCFLYKHVCTTVGWVHKINGFPLRGQCVLVFRTIEMRVVRDRVIKLTKLLTDPVGDIPGRFDRILFRIVGHLLIKRMVEILFMVAGLVIVRWYLPRHSKTHQFTQTELVYMNRATQTEDQCDSMSVELSDMEIDDFFYTN